MGEGREEVRCALRIASRAYQVHQTRIMSDERTAGVSEARRLVAWLLITGSGYSTHQAGDAMERNHTSTMRFSKQLETERRGRPWLMSATNKWLLEYRAALR